MLIFFLLNPLFTFGYFLPPRLFPPRRNLLPHRRFGLLNLHLQDDEEWLLLVQLCRCVEELPRKTGLCWQLLHSVFRIQVSEHRNLRFYQQLSQTNECAPMQSSPARRGTHGTSKLARWAHLKRPPLAPLWWPGSPRRMPFEVALWDRTRAHRL